MWRNHFGKDNFRTKAEQLCVWAELRGIRKPPVYGRMLLILCVFEQTNMQKIGRRGFDSFSWHA